MTNVWKKKERFRLKYCLKVRVFFKLRYLDLIYGTERFGTIDQTSLACVSTFIFKHMSEWQNE